MADFTTMAIGEEELDATTTKPNGEEDMTTMAVGEEDVFTTMAIGEEDGGDLTGGTDPFGA
jgi:hypothetical protein